MAEILSVAQIAASTRLAVREEQRGAVRQVLDPAAMAHEIQCLCFSHEALRAERDALRAGVARLTADLAHWKVCENCGEPLAGPGICTKAISEREKGLEQMHEEALGRVEQAEAERDGAILSRDNRAELLAATLTRAEQAEARLTALRTWLDAIAQSVVIAGRTDCDGGEEPAWNAGYRQAARDVLARLTAEEPI